MRIALQFGYFAKDVQTLFKRNISQEENVHTVYK